MSEHKHTPGPWKPCHHWRVERCGCGDHRGYIWDASGELVIAQLGCETDEGGQCYPHPRNHAEARANAHMLAAAPSMADALEALLRNGVWTHEQEQAAREQGRAALRAAGRLP